MKAGRATDMVLLEHIRDRIARIDAYTGGDSSAFFDSTLVQDAVIRNLQTIAESTQRLSEALRTTEPEIPWRAIAGFRNVLVHDYFGIDLEAAWSVVELDLPSLAAAVERMAAITTRTARPPE